MARGWMLCDGTQDLRQLGGAELAGSAGPVAVAGQSDVRHVAKLAVHRGGPFPKRSALDINY